MTAQIRPGRAVGTVHIPGSKSVGHRLLICAALAEGQTVIDNLPAGDDVAATLDCLSALGAGISRDGGSVTVTGLSPRAGACRTLACRESGSTLRFLLPLCASDGIPTRFTGSARLFDRPLGPYEDIFREKGVALAKDADGLTVCGRLTAGDYTLPGGVSSQFVTGLLLCLPRLAGDSRITLTSAPESASYIGLTVDALRRFGVRVDRPDSRTLLVPGGQTLRSPGRVCAEGDESTAAFFGALNLLGGSVSLTGLDPDTKQGDRVWRQLYGLCADGCPTVSVADCPDLAPVLTVLGALLHGVRLTDTRRLRYKESDRGAVMAEELAKCGVPVTVGDNDVTVPGGCVRAPAEPLDSHNDHRVAMSLALLCSVTGGELRGAGAVGKSCPGFWAALASLGVPVRLSD